MGIVVRSDSQTVAPNAPSLRRQFSASFSALPALKDTVVEGPMATGSPVRGFPPVRAGRLFVENLPENLIVVNQ